MEAQKIFCHNPGCCARGQTDRGNIRVHQHKPKKRYQCTVCSKTFVAHKGTLYDGLRTEAQTVDRVLILLNNGCPLRAIEFAFELSRRTIKSWQKRAGKHCQAVHQSTIAEAELDLEHVQADEIRVKTAGGVIWMALALMVSTRLWLGGCLSSNRDKSLIRALMIQVRACAGRIVRPILVCVDGLAAYPKAIVRAFSTPQPTGKRGRPPLKVWPQLVIGQVIKSFEKRRLVAIETRLVRGSLKALNRLLAKSGCGKINTAFIERFNATLRAVIPALVRRTRGLARKLATLEASMFVAGCMYNFCWIHQSLNKQTPAMAAGIANQPWSVRPLFCYVVAPPPWKPPKRRGQPPKKSITR